MESTDAEERSAPIRVLVVYSWALYSLYRTTKEAFGVHWVAKLPVVPYFINHLSLSTTNFSTNSYLIKSAGDH